VLGVLVAVVIGVVKVTGAKNFRPWWLWPALALTVVVLMILGTRAASAAYGTWWFWLGLGLMAVILLLVGNLERSRVGRAWVAIREDEDAAEVMGVNTFRFKLWAFVIGAAVGGLSGALYAGQVQYVAPPTFNIINSMLFLCAVVLGGQGNKLGVVFGAFVIVYLPNRLMGVHLFGINLGELKYLFFGLALVVLMIFRPQGLFPVRQQLLAYRDAARRLLRRGDSEAPA
jgi:branched-chain amino acid transport system permease protein